MAEKALTFEEVDKHFAKVDLKPFKPGGKKHFKVGAAAAAPADVLSKVCSIYKVVRPFLALVSNLPLIPAKWKAAIKTFMGLMDGLCP